MGTYFEGDQTDMDGSAESTTWKIGVYDNIGIHALHHQSGQSYSLQNNPFLPGEINLTLLSFHAPLEISAMRVEASLSATQVII